MENNFNKPTADGTPSIVENQEVETPIADQPPPPISTTPPAQEPPKPKSKTLIVLLILLILVLFGIGSYFAYSKGYLDNILVKPTLQPTPTIQTSSTPTPDPTTNWIIYANKNYGYEFKCPKLSDHKIELQTSDGITKPYYQESCTQDQDQFVIQVVKLTNPDKFTLESVTTELNNSSLEPIDFQTLSIDNNIMITYKTKNSSGQIEASIAEILLDDQNYYIKIRGFQDDYFNQILSTFKFIDDNTSPSPTPPGGWILHKYTGQSIKIYLPSDWDSNIENFSTIPSSLIKIWKRGWSTIPVQIDIKNNWDNTGNAKDLKRDYTVGPNILAARVDPPKKEEQTLERYQTNVYFENNGKVFIFTCIHNWDSQTLETCNNILKYLLFE